MVKQGRVLNKHRDGIPAGAVYIGRGSPHGNKFKIGEHGTRDEVCDKHDHDLANDERRLRALDELAGKDVVCFCKPARCHGDTLVMLAAIPFEARLEWARGLRAKGLPQPRQGALGLGRPRGK